ncbi:membrane anchored protein [Streptococcus porcinus]|nr:membrane anchored protein [Streptococcus porcinus]
MIDEERKGNKMEFETNKSKQLKNTIALTSTLALLGASVGVQQQVKAEEYTDQASPNTGASDPSSPKATAEETKKSLDAKEAKLEKQSSELDSVNTDIKTTNEQIAALEADRQAKEEELTKAKQTLETVSNASETEFKALVDKHKEEISKTESQIQVAQATETQIAKQVNAQTSEVTAATNEAKRLVERAAVAKKQVTDLNNLVNKPKTIATQAENATKAVQTATADLAKAQNNLTTVTSATKTQLSNELASNQKSLESKKAELAKVQSTTGNTTVNILGANKMVAPTGFPIAEVKKLVSSGYIGSQSYVNAYNSMKSTLVAKASPGASMNHYVDIAKDLNRFVNPDKLTPEVQNELALFAAAMINSVRQQLGLPPVVVSEGAQAFVRTLTTSYKATHGTKVPSFSYGQPGVAGHYGVGPHDKTLIERAATSVGLIPNDDNMYEDIGFFNDVHTVNGIKRSIYNTIKYMLFTDHLHGNTFGHTVNLLRVDKTNPRATVHLGVSTETVAGLGTHFVVFPATNIRNASLFNQKLVSGSSIVAIDAAKVSSLKTSIANITSKINSLKGRLAQVSSEAPVKAAQNQVNLKKSQLTAAKALSASLSAQLTKLNQSKDELSKQLKVAQENHVDIKAKLDKALGHLSNKKVDLHRLEAKQKALKAQVTSLVGKKVELKKALDLNLDPNRKELAKQRFNAAQNGLKQTTASLAEKNKQLVELTSLKDKLETEIHTTSRHVFALKEHLKKQLADEAMIMAKEFKSDSNSVLTPAGLLADVVSRVEETTSNFVAKTGQAIVSNATTVAKEAITIVPGVAGNQSVVGKVAESVTKNNKSSQKEYVAGSTTAGNIATSSDESTKRAIRAGVVMLAAAGLTGYKLRKGSKK